MPSEQDLEIDMLMEAMERYSEAKIEHDRAWRENGTEHSWDYFGHEHIERLKDARNAYKKQLQIVIEQIVKNTLKHKNHD